MLLDSQISHHAIKPSSQVWCGPGRRLCCRARSRRASRPLRRPWPPRSAHDQEQGERPCQGWTTCAPAGAGGPPGWIGKSGRAAAGSPGGAQAGHPGATQGKAPGRALVAADVHGTTVGQAMPRLLSQEPGFTQ